MNSLSNPEQFFHNGKNKFHNGLYSESIRDLIYAEQLYTSQGKPLNTAEVSVLLAEAYYKLNQIDNARKFIFQAYVIYREHALDEQIAFCAMKLGHYYRLLGDFKKAIQFISEAINIYTNLKKLEELANSWLELATIYQTNLSENSEQPNQAINAYKNAYDIYKKLKKPSLLLEVILDLAHLLINLERYNEAIKYLEEARNLAKKLSNTEYLISIYLQLADIYRNKNNLKKVKEHLSFALKLMKKSNVPLEKLEELKQRIDSLF